MDLKLAEKLAWMLIVFSMVYFGGRAVAAFMDGRLP